MVGRLSKSIAAQHQHKLCLNVVELVQLLIGGARCRQTSSQAFVNLSNLADLGRCVRIDRSYDRSGKAVMSSQTLRDQSLQRFTNRRAADAKLGCELSLNEPCSRGELTFDNALSQRSINYICARRIFFAAKFYNGGGPSRFEILRLASALSHWKSGHRARFRHDAIAGSGKTVYNYRALCIHRKQAEGSRAVHPDRGIRRTHSM